MKRSKHELRLAIFLIEFHRFTWQLNIFAPQWIFQYEMIECIFIKWVRDGVKIKKLCKCVCHKLTCCLYARLCASLMQIYVFRTLNFLIFIECINYRTKVGWILDISFPKSYHFYSLAKNHLDGISCVLEKTHTC